MKAKDLINLIFKVEESKEIQQSLFYTQYGVISNFIERIAINNQKQLLQYQLKEMYIQAVTMDNLTEEQSETFYNVIATISERQSLNINEIIN